MSADRSVIEATILALCATRGAEGSICPSEAARAIAGSDEKAWRLLMHPVREAAAALAREGRIVILRKGRPQDPAVPIRGVVRLRIGEPLEPPPARPRATG
jgi:hypothetical protein